jgi:NAD(P)-dependent dehydrogenase (short-subunit alcohol dehydrogenase family)
VHGAWTPGCECGEEGLTYGAQSIDCGDKKITVNGVAPGAIKTDMFKAVAREYIPDGAEYTEQMVDDVRRTSVPTITFGFVLTQCTPFSGLLGCPP